MRLLKEALFDNSGDLAAARTPDSLEPWVVTSLESQWPRIMLTFNESWATLGSSAVCCLDAKRGLVNFIEGFAICQDD